MEIAELQAKAVEAETSARPYYLRLKPGPRRAWRNRGRRNSAPDRRRRSTDLWGGSNRPKEESHFNDDYPESGCRTCPSPNSDEYKG